MARRQTVPALHSLDRLLVGRGEALPDGHLLERFALLGDEAAFTLLVRRHGSLVLGTCRRVLHNSHDADDCFQATFLVLARKAHSLTVPQTLAPWLHSVALRTALKARDQAGRRRQREEKAARPVAVKQPDDLLWRDLRPVLDAAVQRLPAKYRDAFVLCCLEGSTVAEAARRLGCPLGTAAARLARAKERLRAGLSRRGVTLGAVALGVALAEGTASARVRATLVSSAVRVAGQFAARGSTAVGAGALRPATAQGIIEVTHMTRTMRVVALLLLLLAGAGAMMGFPDSPAGGPPAPTAEQAPVSQGPRVRFLSLAEAVALARRPAVVRRKPLTAEGERVRNEVLKNVEVAYWDLYAAYWKLHSREEGLRMAYKIWKAAGGVNAARLAQVRGQYELFRGQRLAAKEEIAKAEKELSKLLNLGDSGRTQFVPCDAPTLAPYCPDYKAALQEALIRPEVRLARHRYMAVKVGQLLAPSLLSVVPGPRQRGDWAPTPSFTPYFDPALVAWKNWQDEELKTEQFLALCWRRLIEFDEQVRAQRAQREAYGLQLRLESERFGEQITADDTGILEAGRFYTDALANEYQAIADCAKNRCQFAFARGTILEYDRDRFGGELLRAPVGEELLKRERKRTRSLVLHASGREVEALEEAREHRPTGKTVSDTAITLPELWKAVPPLKEVDALPPDGAAQPLDGPVLISYAAAELFPTDAAGRDNPR